LNTDDVAKRGRRRKRDYEQDETVFDHDGLVDVEATKDDREFDQKYHGRYIPPNPPPDKIGDVDAKTLCRRAVSELVDCGSCKSVQVMLFYIDSANRGTGNCWPAEETTARKLRFRNPKNTKAVTRANRWWRFHGYKVNGQVLPFLTLARKGRRKLDGTKGSNAYHIGWLPLLAMAAESHWCEELRAAASAYVAEIKKDKSVQNHRSNVS
jgi:hypothetical protein